MSSIRDDLAETISFVIRLKSHYLRKAKLTEQQCRIDSRVIADHILQSNFVVMRGAPGRSTHSTPAELDRAQEHQLAWGLIRQLECEVAGLKDNSAWSDLRLYVEKRLK